MGLMSRSKNVGDSCGKVKEEEAEFAFDLRLARRRKQRGFACENLGLGSSSNKAPYKTILQNNKNNDAPVEAVTFESDYKKFLNDWIGERYIDFDVGGDTDARCMCYADFGGGGGGNVKDVSGPDYMMFHDNLKASGKQCMDYADGINGGDNVSHVFDPHFMMFLNHLKKDKKSYVLELTLDNGTSTFIKYEKETGSINGSVVENSETTECCLNQDNKTTEDVLSSHLGREKTEHPEMISRSNLGRNLGESSRRIQSNIEREKLKSSGRQKTESSILTCRSNSGTEQTESPRKILWSNSREIKTDCFRKALRSKSKRKSNEGPSMMHDVLKREKSEGRITFCNSRRENNENLSILNDLARREKAESGRTFRDVLRESMGIRKKLKERVLEKKVKKEADDLISNAENDCPSKRHIPKATINSAKYKYNNGVRSELADESFLAFMKFVKNGQQMVHAPEDGEEVTYMKSDSDSEVVVLDLNPFSDAGDASFVAIGDEGCREFVSRRSQYEFRDKLVEFLQKPYDRKECNKRKLAASSLLDEYPDVAALIDQAQRNKPRILNLLRGFLYYLQNIAHEGIFKPWLDPECLSILPPTEDAV